MWGPRAGIGALLLLQVALLPLSGHATQRIEVSPLEYTAFAEPLVSTAPTTSVEDAALSKAVEAYRRRADPGDLSSLIRYLTDHPHSGWSAAVLTNLGLSYLHDGYFSRAIAAWQDAWAEGRNAEDPAARALVDRAIGELARLRANLGHTAQLAALFADIGDRPVTGSATEAIQTAREQLTLVKSDPRHLFICGPLALHALMLAEGANPATFNFLQFYRAGESGTNLAEVSDLADQVKLPHRMVLRKPGQPVPVPSIVHWKVGHFAAIVGKANGRFHVQDAVFSNSDIWVTQAALDAEASGYFLVPGNVKDGSWQTIDMAEARTVWGKGPTNGTRQGDAGDPYANGPDPLHPDLPSVQVTNHGGDGPGPCPLCSYNIKESSVSLSLSDVPVGYSPPIGPSVKVRISYNQREDSQPQNFGFFNVSQKWTINWLSYVTDDPTNPGADVSRFMSTSGAFFYSGYNATARTFAAQDDDGSILALSSQSPIIYRRQLRDGSVEIYSQSDESTSYPRNIFLTQVIDPQGNAATLHYDSQRRLTFITDAVGRNTTFTYGIAGRPLLITRITDPFGRSAVLTYDPLGRLTSITDIIGLTSSFTYDDNSLVNSLTTPYGTTRFAYTTPGTSNPPRFVQVTDPLGYKEREEWLEPAPIPASDPAATVPQGMPLSPVNQYLTYRNSFHWDKHAYVEAGCTDSGGCDYTKARVRHFVHMPGSKIKGTAVESMKNALENRVWFNYPGQDSSSGSIYGGTSNQPIAIGRVLDDGTTQISRFSYDASGFHITQAIDPVGRTTSYAYANGIDLSAVSQVTESGVQTILAQYIYNGHHRPLFYTDAAGRTTTYEYNAGGQVTSITDPLGEKTTYAYDADANLASITNANSATAASYTYDDFTRVKTFTDSEGWRATYDYDAADRVTKITYPDGTSSLFSYEKLDLASFKDREGRVWRYEYDANRRLTKVIDPAKNETLLGYSEAGQIASLTDPKGNVTAWAYDIQNRLVSKSYADQSATIYSYENTTSRLKSVLDALGQTKQYAYAQDDRLKAITYVNAVNPTPNVGFTYDPFFPRLATMVDGSGTTQYAYYPAFSDGALQPQQECFTVVGETGCSHEISYSYDALGRMSGRTIAGSEPETFSYDAIGRLTGHSSALGAFSQSYLGQTAQLTTRQLLPASANLKTTWSYLDNAHDRRLAGIANSGLVAAQYTNFTFETTPENFISRIAHTSDAAVAEPTPTTQTIAYNHLNQITEVSGQPYSYDANGNLLSDGERSYSWDAENRLVGVVYSGQPGKQTSFVYDGFGRRIEITSTPADGDPVATTDYLWCGIKMCQARDINNTPLRSYFDQGEVVEGEVKHPLYYGVDQLGSVRRVFEADGSAPSYDFNPYGVPLQSTASLTDFGYAGMFSNAESSLNLTLYRAYNPETGIWLSRDPLGEAPGIAQTILPLLSKNGTSTQNSTLPPYGAEGGIPDVAGWSPYTNFVSPVISYGELTLPRVTNQLYSYVNSDPLSQIDPEGDDFRKIAKICYMIVSWEDFPEPPEPASPENPAIRMTMTPPKAPNGPPYGPKFIIQR